MMTRRFIFVLVALAACSDVPGTDDPRTSSSYVENGSCGGTEALCEDRAQAQCNSGCMVATGCKSVALEQCAAIHDPNACASNTSCQWFEGACEVQLGLACNTNSTQVDCSNDVSGACTWGPTCTGYPSSCFDAMTKAACTANVGCSWTPGN